MKLTVQDDIESYLITFERRTRVRGEGEPVGGTAGSTTDRQGIAGLHAAMRAEDAVTYQLLKEAILRP